MIRAGAAALLLLACGADAQQPRPRPVQEGMTGVRGQIIIRVSTGMRRPRAPGTILIEWQEGRGPRCVSARRIAGAAFASQNSVDFILRDRSRIRARLERRCPAIDFYRNFYIRATEDGQICADRDSIRSRTGGECEIERFRSLTPGVAR